MSAWIVGNESINKIVNSFYWLRENEHLRYKLKDKFKISFEGLDDEKLNKQLKKFGQLLTDLNQNSVNQRYNTKDKPFKFELIDDKGFNNIFQFLKSVECLGYQSCEGNCDETKIYKFLMELESFLRFKIIEEIDEYKKAKWE